jgi:hypothetical protein
MKNVLLLMPIVLILACAKKDFSEGTCVSSPDGITFKINKIQDDKYLTQKLKGKVWETETSLSFGDVSLSSGFDIVNCPQKQ